MLKEKDIFHLMIVRQIYATASTIGYLYINGKFTCYVLEDAVRLEGLKIKEKTAIPAGFYRVTIEESKRFGRGMLTINDVPNFTGIRIHGGNTAEDTAGCPLVAYNWVKPNIKDTDNMIYKSAEQDIKELVQNQLLDTYISIINLL